VRLIDELNISEIGEVSPPQRCVFADSWFASVATVLASRTHFGLDFAGPVKTVHANFPIEAIRFTLSKMRPFDFIVLKCNDVPKLWAIGWHDHHFKCYITTHSVTIPGKPAPKRRQDKEGSTWLKEIPHPDVIAKYQNEMGYVDRHNNFRQYFLYIWLKLGKPRTWQTRIQLELLGMTMVDAFLACRKLCPGGNTWTMNPQFFGNLFTLSRPSWTIGLGLRNKEREERIPIPLTIANIYL
jgi:hypothetical protein